MRTHTQTSKTHRPVPAVAAGLLAEVADRGVHVNTHALLDRISMLAGEEDPNVLMGRHLAGLHAVRAATAGHGPAQPVTVSWAVAEETHALVSDPSLAALAAYPELLTLGEDQGSAPLATVAVDATASAWAVLAELAGDDVLAQAAAVPGDGVYLRVAPDLHRELRLRGDWDKPCSVPETRTAMVKTFFTPAAPAYPAYATALHRLFPRASAYVDSCRALGGSMVHVNRLANDRTLDNLGRLHQLLAPAGVVPACVVTPACVVLAGGERSIARVRTAAEAAGFAVSTWA